jgi:predicted phage-related endonuclease
MPLTQEQLERRRQGIGSSDIPAILGYSKWANAHDIYLQKVYGTDSPTTDAMKAGNCLEEGILHGILKTIGGRLCR